METTFAELVDSAALAAGLNDYQLSAAIGLLPGNRVYQSKQVRRLRNGQVRHPDPELVARLIEVLRLDPDEAYHAAGIWPPDLDLAGYRRYRQFLSAARSTSDALTHRLGTSQGRVKVPGRLVPFPLHRHVPVLELEVVAA